MDLGIKGKTALVLGARGGLGGAIAEALAAEGANVAIAGRNMETRSKTLAREVAPFGITANVVLPGRIATPRIAQLDKARSTREGFDVEAVVKDSLAQIPAGRYGEPQEYGDAVAFLASARPSYMTGSAIRVVGGYISHV